MDKAPVNWSQKHFDSSLVQGFGIFNEISGELQQVFRYLCVKSNNKDLLVLVASQRSVSHIEVDQTAVRDQ